MIDDPKALTDMILQALQLTGTRALISRGWSKLGQGYESNDTSKANVYRLSAVRQESRQVFR